MAPSKREQPSADSPRSPEAQALARVASAAREVQSVSAALEHRYAQRDVQHASLLELARFSAAMQELKDAREAFDALIAVNFGRSAQGE